MTSIIAPKFKSFTIETLIKHRARFNKNLPQMLLHYPGFGKYFKVFKRNTQHEYFIITKVLPKDNKHAAIYGTVYNKLNELQQNEVKLKHTLKKLHWKYLPTDNEITTDNGLTYNILQIERLKEQKKALLNERNSQLGLQTYKAKTKKVLQKKK